MAIYTKKKLMKDEDDELVGRESGVDNTTFLLGVRCGDVLGWTGRQFSSS